MELLPQELLLDIFKYLRMNQKQECMLVCHYWASIIRSKCLFDTVDLFAGNLGNGPLSRLMDEPTQCAKIKHLILKDVERRMYKERFFEYFENLNSICLKTFQYRLEDDMIINTQEHVVRRHNQLTNIIGLKGNYYSPYLLASELCTNLTSLTVHFEPTNEHNNNYFSNLSNAPNLTNLTLTNLYITINRLETIHVNSKKLEMLDIRKAYLQADHDSALPASVAPCTCLKTFFLNIENGTFSSDAIIFDYLKRKYINLEHLGFIYDHFYDDLESYEGIHKFITEGLALLLQHFGPQIKTLKTPVDAESTNIITILDQFNCQLQTLVCLYIFKESTFNTFCKSNQYKYVQKLALNITYINDFDISSIYRLVDAFNYLVNLEFRFSPFMNNQPRLCFNYFLDLCPDTLKTLSLGSVSFCIDAVSEKQYTLNKLMLENTILPDGFDTFLSNNCKKLRHLMLDNADPSRRFLNLPDLHLTYLNIHEYAWNTRKYILIKTLDDNKRCKYPAICCDYDEDYIDELASRYGAFVYNTLPITHYEGFVGEVEFGVSCGSIDHLIINTLVVF